jgi:hypothetical protein
MVPSVSVAVLALVVSLQAPAADLPGVLARAGDYVVSLHTDLSLVVADESSVQIKRYYGVASDHPGMAQNAGESSGHVKRDLRGVYALLASPSGGTWQGFRDFYQLEGKALHDQRDRLPKLFVDAPDTALASARTIHAEASKQNLSPIRHNISVPTFALMILDPTNQERFEFKRKGEKKVGDVRTWVLTFTEVRKPTFIASPSGDSMPMRGEVWIDPATGRVVRTQVVVDSLDAFEELKRRPEKYSNSFPRMQMEVTWGPVAGLKTWVPIEMTELYDRQAEIITCTDKYTNHRTIEADLPRILKK